MVTENKILKAALEYHKLGWSIIPIHYGTKKAQIPWKKYQQMRPDEKQIIKWFSKDKRNIAVILGEISRGLACRDFDTMTEYDKWAVGHPDLAKILPTVRTANGYHVYFEGHIEGIKHIANGELRGSNGYCILPPSLHPDLIEYEWINPICKDNMIYISPEESGFLSQNPDSDREARVRQRSQSKTEDYRANIGIQRQTESNIIRGGDFEKVIKETVPKSLSRRNRQIFEYARTIKAMPQYADADPTIFRDVVKRWHELALPNIQTKEFEETWFDFLYALKRVKYPKGQEPMAIIFERAVSINPPELAVKLYPANKKIQLLATLCRELQQVAGDSPFFLSVRTAAKYLDIDKNTANKYLFLLYNDSEKILQEIEKGGTTKENIRRASRYKYIAD